MAGRRQALRRAATFLALASLPGAAEAHLPEEVAWGLLSAVSAPFIANLFKFPFFSRGRLRIIPLTFLELGVLLLTWLGAAWIADQFAGTWALAAALWVALYVPVSGVAHRWLVPEEATSPLRAAALGAAVPAAFGVIYLALEWGKR